MSMTSFFITMKVYNIYIIETGRFYVKLFAGPFYIAAWTFMSIDTASMKITRNPLETVYYL
jgi:hypothetical protein